MKTNLEKVRADLETNFIPCGMRLSCVDIGYGLSEEDKAAYREASIASFETNKTSDEDFYVFGPEDVPEDLRYLVSFTNHEV